MKKVIIHTHKHLHIVDAEEILYCKSDNSYTDIFLRDGQIILISKSLSQLSKELDSDLFIRINQSYLVNKSFIKTIDKQEKRVELINQIKLQFTITIKELIFLINSKDVAVITVFLLFNIVR